MDQKQYRLHSAPGLFLPADDADRLLSLANGDCALLYLYLLRTGGVLAEEEAARALRRSTTEIRAAADALRRAQLLGEGTALPPPPELPEYSAEDILRRSREDRAFGALVAEAQARLGHILSSADLKTLFGIYDRLGLPCDVIMLVINRCAERARRRYGEGRLPTMHAIEKEAYIWCNREILTLERAEEYLAALDAREAKGEELKKLLQISGRDFTATERRYVDSWLELGFPMEAFAIAYDRTVVSTGKLAWKYMDTILRSWAEKGLRTAAEIEKGDSRGKAPAAKRAGGASWQEDDAERLARILDRKG